MLSRGCCRHRCRLQINCNPIAFNYSCLSYRLIPGFFTMQWPLHKIFLFIWQLLKYLQLFFQKIISKISSNRLLIGSSIKSKFNPILHDSWGIPSFRCLLCYFNFITQKCNSVIHSIDIFKKIEERWSRITLKSSAIVLFLWLFWNFFSESPLNFEDFEGLFVTIYNTDFVFYRSVTFFVSLYAFNNN